MEISGGGERVILVDEDDHEIGVEEKLRAHLDGGKLHRAFSAFVFNSAGEMLLQQRAMTKYHFPGRWANTCCSHPRPGEGVVGAATRRLMEELGFETTLTPEFQFVYRAEDAETGLVEHELDHVLWGQFDGVVVPNPEEVAAVRWSTPADVQADLKCHPERYSPWFPLALTGLLERAPAIGPADRK